MLSHTPVLQEKIDNYTSTYEEATRDQHYTIAEKSDVGRKRLENQDFMGHLVLPEGVLAVVCDGMGGYKGGEVASQLGVETILSYFDQSEIGPRDNPFAHLTHAIQLANHKIWARSQEDPRLQKMGTTVVAALCYKKRLYVAHVGDSRLYLVRNGSLLRVTKDHSMVQRLVDEGKLDEKDVDQHPQANVISRVLGQYDDVKVECQPKAIALNEGDRVLLCSDGPLRMVSEEKILHYLARYSDPTHACEKLINAANQAGGKDNSTVQIIDYTPPTLQQIRSTLLGFVGVFLLLLGFTIFAAPKQAPPPQARQNQATSKQSAKNPSTPNESPAPDVPIDLSTPPPPPSFRNVPPLVPTQPVVRKRPLTRYKRKRRRRRYRKRRRRRRRRYRRRRRRRYRKRRRRRRRRRRRKRPQHRPPLPRF